MAKKSILLFVRALVIGVLVNVGIYYVSNPAVPEQEVGFTRPVVQDIVHLSLNK